jgi:hypothetical protein
MDRDIEWREPVFHDPLDIVLLDIGQGCEVAVAEREPVVVVADIEDIAQAFGKAIDKTEVTAVGAAADAGRLQGDAERNGRGPLDVELDLFSVGLADVEEKLVFGGEELPIEEVFELATVHRNKRGPGDEAQFFGN